MTNKCNIILVLILIIAIAVMAFFWFFYTPHALKKAEIEYNTLKTELVGRNEVLEKEIAALNEHKIKIERELNQEKANTAQLEKRLKEINLSLSTITANIRKMTDSDVVINTRNFLTQYMQKNPPEEKTQLTNTDLIQTKTNVLWSFFSMRVNLGILTEHDKFKTELIPTLEAKCTSLEKQNDANAGLYRQEQRISQDRKEQYDNEKKLRLASEDLYAKCKRNLKSGKTEYLLMGAGIGAGLVLIFTLLK